LYSSPDIIVSDVMENEVGYACSTHGREFNSYQYLVGYIEGAD
jgi:hypothetical protein